MKAFKGNLPPLFSSVLFWAFIDIQQQAKLTIIEFMFVPSNEEYFGLWFITKQQFSLIIRQNENFYDEKFILELFPFINCGAFMKWKFIVFGFSFVIWKALYEEIKIQNFMKL